MARNLIARLALAALALCVSAPVLAQATYPTPAGSRVNGVVPLQCDTNGANCAPPTNSAPAVQAGKQETFTLVAANTPSSSVIAYGGDYIFSQTCTAYGTVNLQVMGPDGVTYQTVLTKSASDTVGGTGLALGSNALVRATVSGTTGCNAILTRVP